MTFLIQYVLCIELLNLAIQANRGIKGSNIGNEQIKITLHADDATLFSLSDLD